MDPLDKQVRRKASAMADAFQTKERLRSEPGSRPEVVIRIVNIIRVELELVVVEVEVRRVREVVIGVWILPSPVLTPKLESGSCWKQDAFLLLNFIWQHPLRARSRQRASSISSSCNTLPQIVVGGIPAAYPEGKELGDGNP